MSSDSERRGERIVHGMSEGSSEYSEHREVSLRDLMAILWRDRWPVIAVTAIFAIASVSYALLATEWYRAQVLMTPVERESGPSLAGQLGGLAALAGVSVGEGKSAEAIATLESRDFAREFIDEFNLLPVFFADQWDSSKKKWHVDNEDERPDIRDAVKFFRDNVIKVSESSQAGLVTLSIEWTDPETAANWANTLVGRINERLRERALKESQNNVMYLQGELAKTSVVTLQQSIGRLLEGELQKLMLARGDEEFAFRVIDKAIVPKERARPNRTLVCILGTILGGMLGIFGVFFARAMRRELPR